MELQGQIAIVTGGGKGIGKEISIALAREGTTVVLAGRTQSALEETSQLIQEMGQIAYPCVADISKETDAMQLASWTAHKLGAIDILVNNAGIAGPTTILADLPKDSWDEVIAINLTGTYLCSRAVLKHMIPREKGNIINISSVAGQGGLWGRSPYATSKAGVIGLTKTLALEVGIHGIRVNAICPGIVAGPRIDQVFENRGRAQGIPADAIRERVINQTSLRRLVAAEEVAAAAVYLASANSSGITGQTIEVNAGLDLGIR